MTKKKYFYLLYLIVSTTFLLSLFEVSSFFYLGSKGIPTHLFFGKRNYRVPQRYDGEGGIDYGVIDPHLGYAHSESETGIKNLNKEYQWKEGFLIYSNKATDFERPVILTLGGSTTDGLLAGHSWPEELAKDMKKHHVRGTVINGGTSGYSTNQELLKLIRDGLEFKPDIVISYSGINDRGQYSELPYPMVNAYQRQLLEVETGDTPAWLFPSTVTVLRRMLPVGRQGKMTSTLGLPTSRTLGDQYRKNVELMSAACASQGCSFDAFIQPFAFYKSRYATLIKPEKGERYIQSVLALYDEITHLPETHSYVHDATKILETEDGVYLEDGVHLTKKGDKVVGEFMFRSLQPKLRKKGKYIRPASS